MISESEIRNLSNKYNVNPNYVAVDKVIRSKNIRILCLEGGTRSGKTYNVLLWLIQHAYYYDLGNVAIVRETRESMKHSVEATFFNILDRLKIYRRSMHFKREHCYRLNSTMFYFIGADDPQKLRGIEMDITFANELNGFKYYSFNEIALRTRHKIICDYNPTMLPFHFIYQTIEPRDDAFFFTSNYKDNLKFLPESQVREIEMMEKFDKDRFQTLGLGKRAKIKGVVYPNWQIGDYISSENEIVVMDLGFNDPTTISFLSKSYSEKFGKEVFYVKNIYYERFKNVNEVVDDMKMLNIKNKLIICDIAPQIVNTFRAHGFKILEADKMRMKKVDAVKMLQNEVVIMDKHSLHLHTEHSTYTWLYDEKNGCYLDVLQDGNDHILDAILYGFITFFSKPKLTNYNRLKLEIAGYSLND
jgi:phage terminase large subunit